VRLGEATGIVPAGRDFVFSGFPRWTPTAGRHVLLCRATVSGQVTEATREVTVGGAVTLVKPVLTTTPATLATPSAATGLTLMAAIARPDLQILPSDITYAPATPKPGDPLTITIVVRNLGDAAANGGKVVGVFQVDGAESSRREFPVTVAPKGMMTLVWPVATPAGKLLTTVGTASIANDSRADNNEARASASIAVTLVKPQVLFIPVK